MGTSDRELLSRVYAAFNARDVDAALELLDRDVDWPNGMEGGRVHGHAGVRDYWMRQWRAIDPHVEPLGFRSDGEGRTIVEVRQRVCDRSGTLLREHIVQHAYEIRDGLIRRMDIVKP
jgi:ketosteroid isomerase-like protein